MLRTFLRYFFHRPSQPTPVPTGAGNSGPGQGERVVLYARLGEESPAANQPALLKRPGGSERMRHRERLMAMRLEHTRLCTPKRCEKLRSLGIVTAGDLARTDTKKLAQQYPGPRQAAAVLKRYRRAIRLAASVPGMMPRDAQLLISIHRRSVRGLATESPAGLLRDLQRYAESTPGRRQLRGRRLPSTRRLKRWIAACETHVRNRPVHTTAA